MPGDQWNGLQLHISQAIALNKPIIVDEAGIPASDPRRTAEFDAKMNAQFAAGVQGFLMWEWKDKLSRDGGDEFVIGPGDPALALLAKYSD